MANSPDLQMHDLICERDQLLRDLASRNSMLDRLNASNERLTAENDALKLRLEGITDIASEIVRIDTEGDSPRWDFWSPALREWLGG